MTRQHSLFFLGVLIPALVLTACGSSETQSVESPFGSEEIRENLATVRVRVLETEMAIDTVSLPADLRPARRSLLAAEVPGRLEKVSVEEGDSVTQGQVLLVIDRRSLEQSVREAEAFFFQRIKQFERASNLFEKQSITQAQMLDALTLKDVAKATLDSAKLQLSKSTLTAPWSGHVASRRVELGDYVQPGQAVLEIIEVGRLKVSAPVAAADVPYIEIGAPVLVRIDAFEAEIFEGTIVRTGAELDPKSRTLQVEAELLNPEGRIKPGLPARIEIVRREWPGALLLPAEAVVPLDDQDSVYVVSGDVVERRVVVLGPSLGDRVLVEAGLSSGERIVVEGQGQISDGQRVEVLLEPAV